MSGYNTQGEWESIGNRVHTKRAQDGSGGWLVAECPHVGTDDAKKNAARIAALPELIKLLTEALEHWDNARFSIEPPHRIEWAIKTLAALTKAKGDPS